MSTFNLRKLGVMTTLLVSGALAACTSPMPSTQQPAPVEARAGFNADAPVLPSVSLFRLKDDGVLSDACEGFKNQSDAHHCLLNALSYDQLHQALTGTQQFKAVALGDADHAYSLVIASAVFKAPRSATLTTQFVVDVYWFDQKLQRLRFELPFTSREDFPQALRLNNNPQLALLYEAFAASLVRDLRHADVFSKQTLHVALQSSRYQHELKAAPHIGAFSYIGMQVLHNPAYGASMRYEHTEYSGAYLDVFVYPILSWQFAQPQRLDEEIQSLRRDLGNLDQQGLWSELILNDTRELQLPDRQTRMMSFDGEYRSNQGELLATTAHVYLQGDKFVKVRASYPKFAPVRQAIEKFVQALPASLEVPAESAFMQRLRQGWRNAESTTDQ